MVKAALLVLAGGCSYITDTFSENNFSGDPFPFAVEVDDGAIVIGMQPDGDTAHIAALDVLSPFTVIDHGADAPATITFPDIVLIGESPAGVLEVPRAELVEQQLLTLHPCTDDGCAVGTDTDPHPINAIVGMNSFGSDALRLKLTSQEIFILPDIAGSEEDLSDACNAVLPLPFRGGGTLLFGGTELAFANWRIAIDACFAPNPDPAAQRQSLRGVDMLLVASTSVGTTIIDQDAYDRYREYDASAPPVEQLPLASEYLPSGLVTGHLTTIPSIALVGNSTTNPRAPCRQVYASHLLAAGDCTDPNDSNECPCYDPTGDTHQTFCAAPAVLEVQPPAGLPILVVDNGEPTLQALRAELRPNQPEVDGILGTSAILPIELDIDYPHSRLVGRCSDPATCSTRPELTGDRCQRQQIDGCLQVPSLGDCTP
jgi:hypothetical protein